MEGIIAPMWAEKKRISEGVGPVMKQIFLFLEGNASVHAPNKEYDSGSAEEGHGRRYQVEDTLIIISNKDQRNASVHSRALDA